MGEEIQLRDPLYKLIVRFSNGEKVQHVVADPIEARSITPETRYAVVSSFLCQNPSECTDIAVINLRDVTYFKTERVTIEELSAERRMAGMRANAANADERVPKTISQISFI
jgi:hypothetical protein